MLDETDKIRQISILYARKLYSVNSASSLARTFTKAIHPGKERRKTLPEKGEKK